VLTHCNAGGLATAGYGTALGVVRAAFAAGLVEHVHVDETRPLLQGSRLTAYELDRIGIPFTVGADSAAGSLLARGEVDHVLTGADRIAANGDTANKIGTYGVAVLARHHGIPFYVAAPWSTIDVAIDSGAAIAIEERDAAEVRGLAGRQTAPSDSPIWNPAFDVTPAELITAIITERGVYRAPYHFA
jgi:methylthioribose-1-phosphate isomerase